MELQNIPGLRANLVQTTQLAIRPEIKMQEFSAVFCMCSDGDILALLMMAREDCGEHSPVYACVSTDIAHLSAQIEAKLQQKKESKVFQWATCSDGQKAALRATILQDLVRPLKCEN